jgi:hypothetical protein
MLLGRSLTSSNKRDLFALSRRLQPWRLNRSLKSCARTLELFQKISRTTKPRHSHLLQDKKICQRTAKAMIPPGLEPGTACVLDRSDNQLHHRTNLIEEWQNLVFKSLLSKKLRGPVAIVHPRNGRGRTLCTACLRCPKCRTDRQTDTARC